MNRPKFILFFMFFLILTLACGTADIPALVPVTPSPFPTLTPLPTITLTPTATPDPLLFQESDFSLESCFDFEKTKDVKRFNELGELHLYALKAGVLATSMCRNTAFADMVLEAGVYPAGGAFTNGYGLAFRYDRTTNEYYMFAVSADGRYMFSINKTNLSTPSVIIVNWTMSPAINLGKQINRLKVVAVGEKFQLYVNDQLINEIFNAQLRAGEVGVAVYATDKDGAHISFDNFKVSKPFAASALATPTEIPSAFPPTMPPMIFPSPLPFVTP